MRTGSPASAFAASSPPNPPPRMTMCGSPTAARMRCHAHVDRTPSGSVYRKPMASSANTSGRHAVLGGTSVVDSACPLDCPDACSLSVTVRHGKVLTIDGSHSNPVTEGFICAKVRKFGERVYGPDRLLYPGLRKGRKGEGRFKRVSWDEALEVIVDRMHRAKRESGAESILPYSYGGSNGLMTQDNFDA